MSLHELRAFLLVVDRGSFASAATTLGVSRTTLRRQVDVLEAQAGVQLLERSSKGVVLTEAGRRLVRGGRVMEQEFGALLHAIRETETQPSGLVRVLLPTGLPPAGLLALYGLLRANWPGVRIRGSFADAPQLAKLSDVDLVVWFGDPAPPGADPRADKGAWEIVTAVETRQRLFAHPSYLAARGTPKTIDELASHDILAWLAPREDEPQLVTLRGTTLPLTASLVTMNVHAIHECAQLGLGIAWAPDGGLPLAPGAEPMTPLLEDLVGRDVPIRMGVPRSLAASPRMRVFLDNFEQMRAHVFRAG